MKSTTKKSGAKAAPKSDATKDLTQDLIFTFAGGESDVIRGALDMLEGDLRLLSASAAGDPCPETCEAIGLALYRAAKRVALIRKIYLGGELAGGVVS